MDAERQIDVIADELRTAADRIMGMTSRAMALVDGAASGDASSATALRFELCAILETCAFQDLTGQRLSRLSATIAGAPRQTDPLLNGPADAGEGLDQDAADLIFGTAGGVP